MSAAVCSQSSRFPDSEWLTPNKSANKSQSLSLSLSLSLSQLRVNIYTGVHAHKIKNMFVIENYLLYVHVVFDDKHVLNLMCVHTFIYVYPRSS